MADTKFKYSNYSLPWRIIKNWNEKYRKRWGWKSEADNRKHAAKVDDFPSAFKPNFEWSFHSNGEQWPT